MPLPDVSPVAEQLAGRISGPLQELARQNESEFVANAGALPARLATRAVYPVVVREIPTATKIGCHKLLDVLAGMSMADVAGAIVQHAQATGLRCHPSFQEYHEF